MTTIPMKRSMLVSFILTEDHCIPKSKNKCATDEELKRKAKLNKNNNHKKYS